MVKQEREMRAAEANVAKIRERIRRADEVKAKAQIAEAKARAKAATAKAAVAKARSGQGGDFWEGP